MLLCLNQKENGRWLKGHGVGPGWYTRGPDTQTPRDQCRPADSVAARQRVGALSFFRPLVPSAQQHPADRPSRAKRCGATAGSVPATDEWRVIVATPSLVGRPSNTNMRRHCSGAFAALIRFVGRAAAAQTGSSAFGPIPQAWRRLIVACRSDAAGTHATSAHALPHRHISLATRFKRGAARAGTGFGCLAAPAPRATLGRARATTTGMDGLSTFALFLLQFTLEAISRCGQRRACQAAREQNEDDFAHGP
jgi:hypothetical protein